MTETRPGWLAGLFLALVYLYLLAPAGIVVAVSFNSATTIPSPFASLTLGWYAQLARHPELLSALGASILLALCAAALAVLVSVPAALHLARVQTRTARCVGAVYLLPLVIPQVVAGLALLETLNELRLPLGLPWLILVHAAFVVPFALRPVLASLDGLDPQLEDAARDAGAGPLTTFRRITLPHIRIGVASGFVLAATVSFINLPLSLFLTTAGVSTFPVQLYAYLEARLDPTIAAASSTVIFITLAAAALLVPVWHTSTRT